MMIVQMDKMSAPSSSERAQLLYEKNIELDTKIRKSLQARTRIDPNVLQQMRENFEAIILEYHSFSEQHNVEYLLWQLHYRQIEELRNQFNAALAECHGAKVPPRSDRITKIRLQFRTFLSEATGFYHDLILKIRAKYGLPLGYFSEDSDNRIIMDKDGKKSGDVKKGLISCHRCLICLGNLARHKGQYGDDESKSREFAAASNSNLDLSPPRKWRARNDSATSDISSVPQATPSRLDLSPPRKSWNESSNKRPRTGLISGREIREEISKIKEDDLLRDDPELDKMLKERLRWGDFMAHLVKKKQPEVVLTDLGDDEKMKESGFIIPQDIPSHSWIKRGLDAAPNRYGIKPGRHWDGLDRSNGFEKQLFKRSNEKQATEREAYLWSVSDM